MRKLNSRNATSLHILYIASMLHVLILLDLFLVDMKYIFEASRCKKNAGYSINFTGTK